MEVTLIIIAALFALVMMSNTNTCDVYHRKEGVAISNNSCTFISLSQPATKWHCLEACDNDQICNAAVTSTGSTISQCCLLNTQNIFYNSDGDQLLFYRKGTQTTKCPPGLYPSQNGCSACVNGPGWQEPDCNVCKFGFDPDTQCLTCIQNGLWEGYGGPWAYTVVMTFEGNDCDTIANGTRTTYEVIWYESYLTGGSWDAESNGLVYYQANGYTVIGTTTSSKAVTGTVQQNSLSITLYYQG